MLNLEDGRQIFDTGNLLSISLTYNNDLLRKVIDYLLNQTQSNTDTIVVLKDKLENSSVQKELLYQGSDLMSRIKNLEEKIKVFENKDVNYEEKKTTNLELQPKSNAIVSETDTSFNERINKLEIEIQKLKLSNRIQKSSISQKDKEDQQDEETKNLEMDINFATKSDLNDLRKQLEVIEKKDKKIKEVSESLKNDKTIMELRQDVITLKQAIFGQHGEEINTIIEDKNTEEKTEDIKTTGTKLTPRKSLTILGQEQKITKYINKKIKETEDKLNEIKGSVINNTSAIQGLNSMSSNIIQGLDKKASMLEVKSIIATINDIELKFKSIEPTIKENDEWVKLLMKGDEIKSIRCKITALDSKLTSGMKVLNELQEKFTEFNCFNTIPNQGNNDSNNDDNINQFMEETSEKFDNIKSLMQKSKTEFQELSNSINSTLDSRASTDSVIELENKIYKEIDKSLYTLNKKMTNDDFRKEINTLQIEVKQLYELFLNFNKDHVEDTSLIKRSIEGISCVCCDKDIKNIYGQINQTEDPINWNQLNDNIVPPPKVIFV